MNGFPVRSVALTPRQTRCLLVLAAWGCAEPLPEGPVYGAIAPERMENPDCTWQLDIFTQLSDTMDLAARTWPLTHERCGDRLEVTVVSGRWAYVGIDQDQDLTTISLAGVCHRQGLTMCFPFRFEPTENAVVFDEYSPRVADLIFIRYGRFR